MLYIAFSPLFYSLLIDHSWHLVVSILERYNIWVPSNPMSRILKFSIFSIGIEPFRMQFGEYLGPLYYIPIPFYIWILPKSGRRNQHLDLGKKKVFLPISWYVGGSLPKSGCRFLRLDLA